MTKLILAAAMMLSIAAPAHADHGGRRAQQVDRRLDGERARINAGVRDGSLTRHEAGKLRREMHQIRANERRAAADGHISRHEQARLNRQADHLSRRIYRERHDAARR
jgi:hypothetical protein